MKKLIALFLVVCTAASPQRIVGGGHRKVVSGGGGGSFALVQHTTGFNNAATSVAVAYGSNNTATHLLVVSAQAYLLAGPPTLTIADTTGNTYSLALTRTDAGGPFYRASIWYVCSGLAGANTVTVTASASSELHVEISEWSGNATSSCLDKTSGNDSISTNPTSGSATTVANGELVFGAALSNGGTLTAGTGFTSLNTTNGAGVDCNDEYQIQTSAGSIAAIWTAASGRWVAGIATFTHI